MNTYPLSELKDYQAFKHNTQLRDSIFAERGLDGLADFLVKQHIIQTYLDDPNIIDKPLLVRLAKHHPKDTITKAIAQAWLDDADTFSIPKLTFVERWGKARIVALSSFVIVVPIMTWLIFHYRKEHPDIVGVFLGLEPLLALPGALASWLVYEIVMKVWR